MNRTFWRACARGAGFSFVELLVAITIAGIAFAAMVPMFVQAQSKNSADQVRNQALNVAQDRVERIRALDYAEITTANLQSGTFAAGQFGPTAVLTSGGPSRTMNVTYDVTTFPSGATALTSQYKAVTVSVSWAPPPKPVKTVVVQTVVYRQYAGPTLASIWTTPSMQENGQLGDASTTTVRFSALPDVGWQDGNTKTVHFQVWDNGGTLVTDATTTWGVTTSTTGVTDQAFWWDWDSTFAIDGTYQITATAANASYQGPASGFYFRIDRGSSPGVVGGLTASAGSKQIALTWNAVPTATSYEIFRADSESGPWTIVETNWTSQSWTDAGLSDNVTYWYTVRAVNAAGSGPKASPVSATTAQQSSDVTKPTAPSGLTATGDSPSAGVIHLAWTASTDAESGMKDYQIYRSTSSTTGFSLISTQLAGNPTVYNDTVGSGPSAATYYYYVVARDLALNVSAPSAIVNGTVGAVSSVYVLTLQNTHKTQTRYAWVQCILGSTAPLYYLQNGVRQPTAPSPVGVSPANGTQAWVNLPPGKYNIWVSTNGNFPKNPATSATIVASNVTTTIN